MTRALWRTAAKLLEERAEESRRYLKLLGHLKTQPSDYERDSLEAELYASISLFRSHSDVTLECLDELGERLPDNECAR